MRLQIDIKTKDCGHNIAQILRRRAGISSRLLKRLRYGGILLLNGRPARLIDPVRAGDLLEFGFPDEPDIEYYLPSPPETPILWQDEWLMVCAKPSGLLTHPDSDPSRPALTLLWPGTDLRPVSRLDRDTSGLVLLAKNAYAHSRLAAVIPSIHRLYLTFVYGGPGSAEDSGVIDFPIARRPGSLIERMTDPDGQPARTAWRRLRSWRTDSGPNVSDDIVTMLACRLLSGRTHQIRVHCRAIGWPLVGETLYTDRKSRRNALQNIVPRQALHAAELKFFHPFTGEHMVIREPLPADLRNLYNFLEENYTRRD
ncbi:MAG: RluA family pseudouridine synthase [Clostridiaceae bacterium]|nr:RluA family pseudouridine synthase [Clostridiaceae bacterium]